MKKENIRTVVVKKENPFIYKEFFFSLCQKRKLKNGKVVYKCGNCWRGNINPFGSKKNQDYKCKVCGAELYATTYGVFPEIKLYRP